MTHLVLEPEGRMVTPPKLRTTLRSAFIVLRAVSLALVCVATSNSQTVKSVTSFCFMPVSWIFKKYLKLIGYPRADWTILVYRKQTTPGRRYVYRALSI